MEVRARIILRHAAILKARKALKLTQVQLAERCGVNTSQISSLERLNFSFDSVESVATAVADELGLPFDIVVPPEAMGQKLRSSDTKDLDMDTRYLAYSSREYVSELASPFENTIKGEVNDALQYALGRLTDKEKKVIKMRFFEDCTLEGVGKEIGHTRESVRHIEARAIRKLQRIGAAGGVSLPPELKALAEDNLYKEE